MKTKNKTKTKNKSKNKNKNKTKKKPWHKGATEELNRGCRQIGTFYEYTSKCNTFCPPCLFNKSDVKK